jgi:YHS domain-containing protein
LNGYSPVSIVCNREWRKGSPEFAAEHERIVYHFVDAEELRLFEADPSSYAPRFRGRDPICLVTDNEVQAGDIRFAAFYRNRLYLLSSSTNRKRFIESPQQFENARDAELIHGVARAGD